MTESLVDLGLAVTCETCESEIELGDDPTEAVCRQCGLAFLIDTASGLDRANTESTARATAS
jgi:predicted RNA-binding Zn-ribbon protein involved in translation (DUF1610 family)